MRLRRGLASAVLAATCVGAQDTTPLSSGGDPYLAQSVRAVAQRIAGIVRLDPTPSVVAVRGDETAREAEAQLIVERLLPPTRAAARGRAWNDLGLGSVTEPMDLVVAIVRDVPGMALDASRERLLVDPQRLLPEAGRGDPDTDPDAAILLATGVAPDEPLAGHYLAHAFLDGAAVEAPVTTDALLAGRALAEGSANLAALVLLFEGVGLESEVVSGALHPEEVLGGHLVPGTMRSATPVVSHLLEFVYLDGFAQAAAIAGKGGFGRLIQERKTRRTTRDVLHLDRAPMPPAEMQPPTLPASLGLTQVDKDSLGEQGVISMVSLLTGKDNLGLIAGDGWSADALWRFEPGPGSPTKAAEGATIWATSWKTGEDAADFSYGLERCLQSRFAGEQLVQDPVRGGEVLRRADRVYRIDRNGTKVVFQVLTSAIDTKFAPSAKKKGSSAQRQPAQK